MTATIKATHHGVLTIGAAELPCFVLEDGRRVLSTRGILKSLGVARGTRGNQAGDELADFAAGKAVSPFISREVGPAMNSAIEFANPSGGGLVRGHEASTLTAICTALVKAGIEGALRKNQIPIARQAGALLSAFATVGITALVDEATGYQTQRGDRALGQLLDLYIARELRAWTKAFPDDFYRNVYRLNGWSFDATDTRRPRAFASITRDLVYLRLPTEVYDALKSRNPIDDDGRRRHKHHQFLTETHGLERLHQHLRELIVLMENRSTWDALVRDVERRWPIARQTVLAIDDENGAPS
jgi:hypothetical protein